MSGQTEMGVAGQDGVPKPAPDGEGVVDDGAD